MEFKGIDYLRNKLAAKQGRVQTRYEYYEMKDHKLDPSPAIPNNLKRAYESCLGWCATAVDSLADRLVFEGFEPETDLFNINQIFQMNNPDTFSDSAILSALISSCSFVYISQDVDNYPRLQVIDGFNATGIIDPITGMLSEGYAVLDRDEYGKPTIEAYFIPGRTDYYYAGKKEVQTVRNRVPYPLLVPIINRPDARRPFGHSVISRACMGLQNGAKNTLTRGEITAEFYSYPQKYVVGLSQDAEPMDVWKATMSSMLQFTKDDEGEHPIVGQFQTSSMAPHIEQFKMYASAFAGETGLTLDDLGFVADNPTSADSIKASHERLRLKARKSQRTFGSGLLNVGYLSACMRDNFEYNRKEIYKVKPMWAPIFEPDASSLSGVGDAVIKIQQAFPDYFDETKLHNLTGL